MIESENIKSAQIRILVRTITIFNFKGRYKEQKCTYTELYIYQSFVLLLDFSTVLKLLYDSSNLLTLPFSCLICDKICLPPTFSDLILSLLHAKPIFHLSLNSSFLFQIFLKFIISIFIFLLIHHVQHVFSLIIFYDFDFNYLFYNKIPSPSLISCLSFHIRATSIIWLFIFSVCLSHIYMERTVCNIHNNNLKYRSQACIREFRIVRSLFFSCRQ